MRRPPVRLYGTATGAGAADLGAVYLGERISRGGGLRDSMQLVPVPGELLRSGTLRVDARELERSPARQKRRLCRQASQARVRGIRLRLHLQARARRPARGRSSVDRWAGDAMAERLLSREPFRMARADRR